MTTVAVLVDPPRPEVALPRLADRTPLSPDERADLYAAAATDVLRAVADSGGDLLVNYRPDDLLPAAARRERSAEAAVRDLVREALGDADAVRMEEQVGSSHAARAGNTATHLVEREGASAVVLAEATAPLLSRARVDGAGMKLRRSGAVLGPAEAGRVYLAAFVEPVDFADAYAVPAVETLTDRARQAGLAVDFLRTLPTVETASGLAGVVAQVRARGRAGRSVPEATAAAVEELGLAVVEGDGEPRVVRGDG